MTKDQTRPDETIFEFWLSRPFSTAPFFVLYFFITVREIASKEVFDGDDFVLLLFLSH